MMQFDLRKEINHLNYKGVSFMIIRCHNSIVIKCNKDNNKNIIIFDSDMTATKKRARIKETIMEWF